MPDRAPGPTPISAFGSMLSGFRNEALGRTLDAPATNAFSKASHIGKRNISGELHGLMNVLDAGLRRILVNNLLRGWASVLNWILIGLIVAAAFIPKLAGVTIAAAILTIIGCAAFAIWTWRTRPSPYDVACRLDSAAGFHDRTSTALYFGESVQPEEIIGSQRRDALARLRQLDVRALFPFHAPSAARRTLLLAAAVAGLFTYRMYYRPPLTALLQSTARSSLVRSLLAPLKQKQEDGLQRAQANQNAEAAGANNRPAESAQPSGDLWAPAKGAIAGQDAQAGNPGDANQDPSAKGSGSPPSKALLDALKGAAANQPAGGAKQQLRNEDGANPNQADLSADGDDRQFQKSEDSQQRDPKGTANGAGDQQPGSKELRKNRPLAVKAVPDRVPLQATNLKDQPLVDVSGEAGTSKLGTGNGSAQAAAAANGAEQENIPARYRTYLQRYFQHTDKPQP